MNIFCRVLIPVTWIIFIGISFPVEAYSELHIDNGKTKTRPIFNLMNMAPGEEISKSITVFNEDRTKKNLNIKGIIRSETGNISKVLDVSIKQNNKSIYGIKTLREFFNDSSSQGVMLSTIQPHSTNVYQMTVRFRQSAGNTFQNKRVSFEIQIGYSKSAKNSEH